ncbi:MAG: chemotaxis protein CheW [Nitrospira sp.]|nr:chemotaxis protein CheW [Nitrospira sp.]
MLRARAGRVATQEVKAWRLLAFSIGGRRFAAKTDELAGVSGWREPISVASRTPFVSGVVRLGQTVLPIWDLAARLGLSPRGSERLWLQAKHTLGAMAICIDDEMPVIETVERIAVRPYHGRDVPAHGSFSSGTVEIPILALSLLGSAYNQ